MFSALSGGWKELSGADRRYPVGSFLLIAGLAPVLIFAPAGRNQANRSRRDLRTKSVAERGETVKREFLENLKIGDQALGKDLIDAIMAENGRDIEAAKKPFADYDAIKERLKTAQDGLKAFDGVDVKDLQDKIKNLNTQLSDKDKEWQEKLNGMAFDGKIKDAIAAARGRSAKAIAALLDVDKLKKSNNQDADIKAALETLKKDNAYLFEDDTTPPPYAGGTGKTPPPGKYDAETAKIMAAAGLDPEKD